MEVQKLEVLNEMQRRYPKWINPRLKSLMFCRDAEKVFLEMLFSGYPDKLVEINLDFISNDELDGDLFLPDVDIVDNASVFVSLDQYSLLNCVEGLFTEDAEKIINSTVNN